MDSPKFKIKNSIDQALWEKIPCTCNKGTVMEEHPIKPCQFCRCQIPWLSVPQKSFIVKDKKGKDRKINEIKLIRGRYEDIIAWEFA